MDIRFEDYYEAVQRGAAWLLERQNADGSFTRPDLQADVYQRAPLALALAGQHAPAHRALNWIAAHALAEDGRPRHFNVEQALCKTSWLFQGAHCLGRFEISYPIMVHIRGCQAPGGGFFSEPNGEGYVGSVCSAWGGLAALFAGDLEVARRTASYLASLLSQQPDETRFYYRTTPEGKLLGGELPVEQAPFIDASHTDQPYYCTGVAELFLERFHLATGDEQALEAARGYFEFSLRCAKDRYSSSPSDTSAVAAALLYQITSDDWAGAAARECADHLLRAQHHDGAWDDYQNKGEAMLLERTVASIICLSEISGMLGGLEAGE